MLAAFAGPVYERAALNRHILLRTLQIGQRLPLILSDRMATLTADPQTTTTNGKAPQPDTKKEFLGVYEILRDGLLEDKLLGTQPAFAKAHLKKMLDYNVPGGKLNRGMAVLDVLSAVKEGKLQAFFLVADDIMDNSITRRGQPCWFRQPTVGLMACNDYIVLESCIYRILQKHFGGLPYYSHLLDLFHEATHLTAHGQLLDTLTAPIGTVDLSKYTLATYMRIVTYKTAFYSFYLPVACGLILGGRSSSQDLQLAQDICVQMGQFFQIQDDFLDCFGDEETIGKIGTDIQDNKCSWLVVQALERLDESQKDVLKKNYGKDDDAAVAEVKALYKQLGLPEVFSEYEQSSYQKLMHKIQQQKQLPESVFTLLLNKIYKRRK